MKLIVPSVIFRGVTMLGLAPVLFLCAGCALESTAAPVSQSGVSIEGHVHGGQSPVVGAQVYLLAAGTSGYGGKSTSLMTHGTGTSSIGQYVVTDTQGGFSVTGDYTCAPNTQAYILALGGNPGLSGDQTNSALAMMAVLGNCPASGTFAGSIPFISINEVTTVAAAYALSGFMTDATHVSSSGTPLAVVDIANAFATAGNLVNIADGTAYATTPANSQGIVPQTEINTLGDILQGCVNSNGDSVTSNPATPCYQLFSVTNNGTRPTNTVEAALNIAHASGSNVASLFALMPPVGAAFLPALSAAPNDWTLGVTFRNAAFGLSPVSVAVGPDGSVWTVAQDLNAVNKVSNLGATASGSPYVGFSVPTQVALDSAGNAWVTNSVASGVTYINMGVTKIPAAGTAPVTVTASGIHLPLSVVIDAGNNVWTANLLLGAGNVSRVTNAGTALATNIGPFGGTEEQGVQSIAIDPSGNAWTTTFYNALNRLNATTGNLNYSNTLSSFTLGNLAIDSADTVWIADPNNGILAVTGSTGSLVSGSPFTGGGVRNATSLALDGANNVWVASYTALTTGCTGQVSALAKTGVAITPSTGYTTPAMSVEAGGCVYAIAVDGEGNVWSAGPEMLTEFVGAAVPVHTPITPTALAVRP